MPIPVLFVLLPNTLMLDLAGPAEVLRIASQLGDGSAPQFALAYVGPNDQVATSIGLPLAGIAALPEVLPDGAIVVLVGVAGRVGAQARRAFDTASATVVDWLQRVVAGAGARARVLCICSGALIAARAGLLDGRECTTHYALCDDLRRAAPRPRVLENRLYVTDGGVSTSAGITAGIDLMLSVLASLAGPRAACAVARNMVVYMRRSGTDPQLSAWLSGRNHLHPALHRVQDALAADPVRPWSVAQMAQVACTSTRHLARLFHEHAGASPLDYLHRLRVAVARELIAQSSLDMEAVAARAGFGSARHMRRVWHKFETLAPSDSRSPA
ncbi:GlxA family transcriptional regulator [Massilia sp. S19_KUP03_FR1]|uniref:GlxA family transcriptional regulator n=1 Tax=Massilia sp. S19_KUP03_FR1 TaxID=3025503 RepID=UPI002FCDC978